MIYHFLKKIKNLIIQIIWSLSRKIYQKVRNDIPSSGISNSENNIIKTFLKNKSKIGVIFDIGANIGLWSKLTANIRKDVLIYSFEPIKSTYKNLKKNLKKYDNIITVNKAISFENGFCNIYNYGENSGTNSLHNFSSDKSQKYNVEKIETITIDSFCNMNNLEKIDYIKCDTEGNDFKVILGALNMLKNDDIGVIQFEYNWRWILAHSSLKDVFDIIESKNYHFGKILNNEIQIIDRWNPEIDKFYEANYVIINKNYIKFFDYNFYYFNKRNILVKQ